MRWLCFFTLFLLLEISTIGEANNNSHTATKSPALPKTAPNEYILSFKHYAKTCPNVEKIIQKKVNAWIRKDKSLAPALIRLHFHDCVVRGCDASVLLNNKGGEREAEASKTLRGFQVIDDIKTELERSCPRTVSCADILTTAARDATLALNGPFWAVPFGRKDGMISIAREAETVPQGHETISHLLQYFRSMGLNDLDLVVLSGCHSIGRSSCFAFQERLANLTTKSRDHTIDLKYAYMLKGQCKSPNNLVYLDHTTPMTFDTAYYKNLQNKKGLLSTDQSLLWDSRTSPFIGTFASQQELFFTQFAASMVKLGNIQVEDRKIKGQVRVNCNFVNK